MEEEAALVKEDGVYRAYTFGGRPLNIEFSAFEGGFYLSEKNLGEAFFGVQKDTDLIVFDKKLSRKKKKKLQLLGKRVRYRIKLVKKN